MKKLLLFIFFLPSLLIAQVAHDAIVKDILVDPTYSPGTNFIPQAILKNFGLNSETFDATCILNIGGSTVYNQNCASVTLAAGAEQTVSFPVYVLNAANDLYEITVTTNLAGDMDPAIDSKTEYFNTYTTEREMVVLEIATATWCSYCPGSQMGANDLVTNGCSVAVVRYHISDSFTNTYSDARFTYYGITGLPTAVFDGVQYVVGGSNTQSMYDTYLPIYEGRKALMSAFSVDIFGSNAGLDYDVVLKLNKMAAIPPTWNNLVVHFTVTETDIPFSWQGQTEVDYCERLMVPDELGTTVDLINNTSIDIPLSFTMDASWVTANCQLAAFIQNLDTKEILQGDKVWISDLAPIPAQTFQLTVPISNGWNMVSVPGINPAGMDVDTWWSGKDPAAGVFKNDGTYTQVTTTTPTEGYWMKNLGAQVYNYPAIQIVPHTDVPLAEGWNLIGLYENTEPTATLQTNPPGIITTTIYEYSGGYLPAANIVSGYGYWVKADAAGSIIGLSAPPLGKAGGEVVELFPDDWGKIILTDAAGINYTLYAVTGQIDLDNYELPPMPPSGMFDIRYGSGRIAEDINSSLQTIEMSGVTYPLTVRVEGLNINIRDKINGKILNKELTDGEEIRITNSKVTSIAVTGGLTSGIPVIYELNQNYPNPFNPSTTIKFAIPKESDVNLSIYNVLGELVTTLINEKMVAGYYEYEFNASKYSSGVYLYRIKAGNFVEIKKMVLMK